MLKKKIKTYSIDKRQSKVSIDDFAKIPQEGKSFAQFIDSLPNILAGSDLKKIIAKVVAAKKKNKGVIISIGAHVIKCGLAPILNSLIEKGIITSVCLNGACLIHDFEIALFGQTSEDVGKSLHKGTFGMAEETSALLNQVINKGVKDGYGLAESVANYIFKSQPKYLDYSLLGTIAKYNIPVSAHIAIGTDIIHMHPTADGAAIGEGSMRDFHSFVNQVLTINGGGVYFNIGSAVILPEVFLKAFSILANQGHLLEDFITVNMDFIQHYRPMQNVVNRPTKGNGVGYSLIGHHELLIPLLAAGIIEKIEKD